MAEIKADTLKTALIPARILHTECLFVASETQLEIRVDDPANIASAQIILNEGAFESFRSSGYEIGVDISKLQKILKLVDNESVLKLELDLEEWILRVEAEGQDYKLGLVRRELLDDEIPDIDVNYTTKVIIPGDEFVQAVTAADQFSEEITFYIREDERALVIRGKGDIDMTKRKIGEDSLEEIEVGPAHNTYGLNYLGGLTDAIEDDVSVHMRMATSERPLELKFTFAKGHGEVEFNIAPRLRGR
ncbi:hypothetical protein ACH9L7_11260 [Haloferax sp. S1W]|uniref:hypothetical protein n=1 Tax=Haloferax sp. S1W TaxID=3377110 RepID=UPI0037C977EF